MNPLISVILWTNATNPAFFAECVQSLLAQDFLDFEVVVLDENPGREAAEVIRRLMVDDKRLSFHKLKEKGGPAYAINVGLHRKKGSYVFFMGQHDRISEDALSLFAKEIRKHPEADIIYCDRDELVGTQRMNPLFLPGFNVELLRHMNYIGDAALFSVRGLKKTGTLNQKLESAAIYDLYLRGAAAKLPVRHIPRLLYHVRVFGDVLPLPKARSIMKRIYREHMAVAGLHLQHAGVRGRIVQDASGEYWRVHYDGTDVTAHKSEYKIVRERNVTVRNSGFTERMYGILRQKDVGIVGARFEKNLFQVDNCGYIFDEKGLVYPACGGLSIFQKGYLNRAILPQDVSMVDGALFMIDAKALERVGGFDRRLSGRAQMFDLCLKIQKAGLRVVFDPGVIAVKKRHTGQSADETISDEYRALLLEKWGDELKEGDPFYNRNLPMGIFNYQLYGY